MKKFRRLKISDSMSIQVVDLVFIGINLIKAEMK